MKVFKMARAASIERPTASREEEMGSHPTSIDLPMEPPAYLSAHPARI